MGRPVLRTPSINPSRKISREAVDYSIALYDAQINFWDDAFRRLIDEFETHGWLDNTVVVLVADHGDEFGEHGGFGHGHTVYEEMIHVPLIIVYPEELEAKQVRVDLVRLIDVVPTLSRLAGVRIPDAGLEGVDLFAPERSQGGPGWPVYSETYLSPKPRAVRTNRYQLIFNAFNGRQELYDLLTDPEQMTNLISEDPAAVEPLAEILEQLSAGSSRIAKPNAVRIDEATQKALRSLGYVE